MSYFKKNGCFPGESYHLPPYKYTDFFIAAYESIVDIANGCGLKFGNDYKNLVESEKEAKVESSKKNKKVK